MAFKVSTGLRKAMLDTGSLRELMDGGLVKRYSGTVPATADAALGSAVLLCTISLNSTGTGISFDTNAVGDVLSKAPAEVWSGVTLAPGGTMTFYRHVAPGDDGTASTTQYRIQGEIGTVGKEMNLSSPTKTTGELQTVDYYSVTLPTF